MLAKIFSYGIIGLDAFLVQIEVDVSKGLPGTTIVGLPDNAIKESKDRVRSAIKNSGYKYAKGRVTINLSPADIKKEGPAFDLPIALGLLAATEQIPLASLSKYIFLGELSLDGSVNPVKGILPIILSMLEKKPEGVIVPHHNALEASLAGGINIFPVRSLAQTIHFISTPESVTPFMRTVPATITAKSHDIDFNEVKGQSFSKRGLEIAAAGGHNVLMIGPPGSGKSMLAKRLATILPEMSRQESLETTKIHSAVGILQHEEGLITMRPFRSPHHTSSDAAIVGGGSVPKPGEVTLSHNGILFLDELPEFNRNVLESLRQPLEDQCVTISRATKSLCFPAKFMLVAAMNPCPCGWFTDPKKECHCSPLQVQKYISRISGPLLDRIDIHLEVPTLPSNELLKTIPAESSVSIKQRTDQARVVQSKRFEGSFIFTNAQMNHKQIKAHCVLNDECKRLLKAAIDQLGLSARAYDKILKVARTIADLDGQEHIQAEHLSEAIQYRYLDRNWWG